MKTDTIHDANGNLVQHNEFFANSDLSLAVTQIRAALIEWRHQPRDPMANLGCFRQQMAIANDIAGRCGFQSHDVLNSEGRCMSNIEFLMICLTHRTTRCTADRLLPTFRQFIP